MNNSYINNNTNILQRSLKQKSQQLNLLALIPEQEDPPPYPLQIICIPHDERINPDFICGLIHYESGLKVQGQFTYEEAQEILKTTRHWDFSLDRDRIPKCKEQLLGLLERICSKSRICTMNSDTSIKSEEVAA